MVILDPAYGLQIVVQIGVHARLWEVKNRLFERRNRRDRGLVPANKKCPLTIGVR